MVKLDYTKLWKTFLPIKLALPQAAWLSIFFVGKSVVLPVLEGPKLRTHFWEGREEKKAQHLGFEPTTFPLQGVCSTAVIQPLPRLWKRWYPCVGHKIIINLFKGGQFNGTRFQFQTSSNFFFSSSFSKNHLKTFPRKKRTQLFDRKFEYYVSLFLPGKEKNVLELEMNFWTGMKFLIFGWKWQKEEEGENNCSGFQKDVERAQIFEPGPT